MSYSITLSGGAALTTVADGTVDTTSTSLTLIGKNYAGYGVFLNENYIKLLENFANSTPPTATLTGQLWWDNANNTLKVYNGAQWKPLSSSASSATAPTSPITGDLWWDSVNAQLKVWGGSAWIVVGPAYSTSSGQTGAVVTTINDTGAASHVVLEIYVANTIIAIYSKDTTFTPATSIPGFTTINPGMNLVSSSTVPGAAMNGTISSASTASAFSAVTNITPAMSATYSLGTPTNTFANIFVGTATVNGNIYAGNVVAGTIYGNIAGSAGTISNTASITSVGNLTSLNVLGTVTVNTNNNGIAIANGNSNGVGNSGSSGSQFNSVFAHTFYGTAITAQYADLAERFEADTLYDAGTVVQLGGYNEITAVEDDLSDEVFGVISSAAAFLMNGQAGADNTHPPIAMSGRVPVKVIGKVTKGDRLVSAGNGLARAAQKTEITAFNVIGRALHDKYDDN